MCIRDSSDAAHQQTARGHEALDRQWTRAQRNSYLFVASLNDRGDGGNRAAATNGGAGRDQDGCGLIHTQQLSKEKSENQRKGNARGGVEEAAATGAQDFVQIHSKAQADHGRLEQEF